MNTKRIVIALGGNALLRGTQVGTIQEQNENAIVTIENLIFLIKKGYQVVLTHGNGPQVGNILMRNDAGNSLYGIPQMPLNTCVADSQGGIGYMIERNLYNVLRRNKINRKIITLVSQTIVDEEDSAFTDPVKRVGRIYEKAEADKLAAANGWEFREEIKEKGGWRRVVPSPKPQEIHNYELIQELAEQGHIVIASGGGGIPVVRTNDGCLKGVDAVVDKDKSSALLATLIGANEFYILTDVPYIYKNFKKENQEILEFLDVADTERYIAEGQFSRGSMLPKIEACLDFVKNGGEKAVITEASKLEDTTYGSRITATY